MFGIKESVATVVRHYKEGNLNWPMIIYISLAHAAALIGLFTLTQCHKYTLLWAFILWPIRCDSARDIVYVLFKRNIANIRQHLTYIIQCT